MKAFCEACGRSGLYSAQPHQTLEQIFRKPLLASLTPKIPHQPPYFLAAYGLRKRNKNVRRSKVRIVFRNLIFQNEMITESIPRELTKQPMVLVEVVSAMSE